MDRKTNLKMASNQSEVISSINVQKSTIIDIKTIISSTLILTLIILASIIYLSFYLNNKITKITENINKTESNLIEFRTSINNNVSENIVFLKIISQCNDINIESAREISKSIYKWSRIYDKDPDLMIALIKIESNFDPKQISSATAEGLTQIMPFWYDIFKIPKGSFLEIDTSIEYGFRILSLYEHHYQSIELALTAYNRGHYRIESDLVSGKDPANGYASKILDIYNRLKTMNIGG